MKEEFEKLAASGKIRAADVDTLVQLATEGFCMHKSWGFGQIKTVDVVLGKLSVDFDGRPGHAIDLAFAPKILTPIAKDHIEARKATDMDGLKQMAALHHDEVIKVIVDSYGNLATTDKVKDVLVPDVVEADDYKKWWETARREMKKGGHFKVPTKKTEAIGYQSEDIPLQERLLRDFTGARGLKARLPIAVDLGKSAADLDDKAAAAEVTLTKLNEEINSHARTQPALALEAVMVRDDLARALGAEVAEGAPAETAIWAGESKLQEIIPAMPVARQLRALESYQGTTENWPQDFLNLITQVPARLVGDCVTLLAGGGHKEELTEELNSLINHHGATGELLLWLAKDKSGDYAALLTSLILEQTSVRGVLRALRLEGDDEVLAALREKKTNHHAKEMMTRDAGDENVRRSESSSSREDDVRVRARELSATVASSCSKTSGRVTLRASLDRVHVAAALVKISKLMTSGDADGAEGGNEEPHEEPRSFRGAEKAAARVLSWGWLIRPQPTPS